MKWLDWYGCYEESNKPYYVSEAFSHPAKMAIGLCRRIFEFMEEKKMLSKGDVVADPFAGIGTTLLIGATLGYKCIGNELEEKFVKLTEANIEKIRNMLQATNRTIPIIIQGDSRKLSEIIREEAETILSSPPFGIAYSSGGGILKDDKTRNKQYKSQKFSDDNISNLPEGNATAIISSPPYADQQLQASAAIGWKYIKLAQEGKMEEAVQLYRKEVWEIRSLHNIVLKLNPKSLYSAIGKTIKLKELYEHTHYAKILHTTPQLDFLSLLP